MKMFYHYNDVLQRRIIELENEKAYFCEKCEHENGKIGSFHRELLRRTFVHAFTRALNKFRHVRI
jgi:hypothetical protein